jgi:hypothetical protein
MNKACPSKFPALVDQLLLEPLPSGKMAQLRGHLAGCPSCQQRFNRVMLASRLLDGGPRALDRPSELELSWVESAVLERTRLVPDSAPATRSMFLRWATGLAATAAALAIVIPLALRSGSAPSPLTGELQARGAKARPDPGVGLRAFCIDAPTEEGAKPRIVGLEPTPAGARPPRCSVKALLKLAYTNRSKLGYLFLVGLDRKHRIKWYEPHPPAKASIAAEPSAADKPLSRAIRLEVNHQPGPVRIFALFSHSPIQALEIEQAVARVRDAGTRLDQLEVLPLDNTKQHSILIELQ